MEKSVWVRDLEVKGCAMREISLLPDSALANDEGDRSVGGGMLRERSLAFSWPDAGRYAASHIRGGGGARCCSLRPVGGRGRWKMFSRSVKEGRDAEEGEQSWCGA